MYSDTIGRLQVMAATLQEWSQPAVALNRFWVEAYRSNRDHVLKRVDGLSKEITTQRAEYETSKKRLEQEMKTWFTGQLPEAVCSEDYPDLRFPVRHESTLP